MSEKKYYADVEVVYAARKVFDSAEERDSYLRSVSDDVLKRKDTLYDSVDMKLGKDSWKYSSTHPYGYVYKRKEDEE